MADIHLTSSRLSFLFWTLLLLCFNGKSFAQTDTIYYDLEDNTLEQIFIGNVVRDAGLQLQYTSDVLQELSYVFLNSADYLEYFILGEKTGNIKTSQLLDRDVLCPGKAVCQLELDIAVQPNAYFRVIKVFLTVSDENDNAPRFKQNNITYELPESTQTGIITPLVPATDLDSPANGVKGYRLVDASNKFKLKVQNNTDYSSLEVSLELLHTLDREVSDTHHLKVIAFDAGSPSRSGTLDLTIKVLDVNDHHPQFEQRTYQVDVNESFPLNKSIIQVYAMDEDSGKNGLVTYSFNPNTIRDIGDTFTLESNTGIIKLKKKLDFETRSFYSLTVVAQDEGINSIPSNSKVLISVLDVNDIEPKIIVNDLPEDGVLHVKENLPKNTFVSHLSIHDEENGDNGRAICQIEENYFFALDELYEKEYKIVTTRPIDREKNSQVLVRVICQDLGKPSLTTEVELVVKIDDENDNTPMFVVGNTQVQIEEGNLVGSKVTKIEATDADEGMNGEIRYYCEDEYFEINAVDGVVTAKKTFDREDKETFFLNIMATDLGETPKHDVILLTVTILDVNDNNPVFDEKSYTMNITENAELNTYIGRVHAQDLDSNDYNRFYYYLSSADSVDNKFTVNNRTGAIYTNFEVDRELRSEYKIHVIVRSDGVPDVQDDTIVTIYIIDENDNAPIISFPSSQSNHIVLSNEASVGYRVTKIVAYDIDTGNSSVLSYQLSEQENDEYFYVDGNTGNIYVNRELGSIKEQNFTLKVLVSDFGNPRKTSVSTLFISVNSSVALVPYLPNIDSGLSIDVIAIVVGCLCGALIAALLIVLFVLLVMRRRRKKQQDAIQTWVQSEKGNTNTIMNRHFSGDGQEDINHVHRSDINGEPPQVVVTEDVNITVTDGQRSQTPPVNIPGERDSDSGCFDLSHSDSQSSNEGPQYTVAKIPVNSQQGCNGNHSNIQQQLPPPPPALNNTTATVVQTKCYHPHSHQQQQQQQQPHTSTAHHHPQNTYPMSTFNPQPTYPAPQLNSESGQNGYNVDFVQPHTKQNSQHSNKPKPPPRFSDYVQNESQQLKQRGHVYRVSNPRSLKPSNSVKKTVRFSEPENDCDRSNSPRAIPNEYVTSADVAGYKNQNGGPYYNSNNANNNSSINDYSSVNNHTGVTDVHDEGNKNMVDNNSSNNPDIYELSDSEALHLNSLV